MGFPKTQLHPDSYGSAGEEVSEKILKTLMVLQTLRAAENSPEHVCQSPQMGSPWPAISWHCDAFC